MNKELGFFLGGSLGALVSVLALAFLISLPQEKIAFGSALQGNDYQSTTTAAKLFGTFDGLEQLKTGQGALAQVVITGAGAGVLNFYDATTSDITKRSAGRATSSIVIASLPTSLAAGTYTFDAEFADGLLMELYSGVSPTSTVMWR